MQRLNVGCGRDYRDGWVNLDINPTGSLEVDVDHDILDTPWPFEDASFDHVLMRDVLEHVPHDIAGHKKNGFFVVLEEIHRILKPNGTAEFKVPHWRRGGDVWLDPTHTRVVHEINFEYLTEESAYNFYTDARFAIRERRVIRRFSLGYYLNDYHYHRVFGRPAPAWLTRVAGVPHELVVVIEKRPGVGALK